MLKEQKEKLSSFMDGEFTDDHIINDISDDESLRLCWHRYHIVRGALRGELHNSALTLDVSNQIAQAIANDNLYNQLDEQPIPHQITHPKVGNLLWVRMKDVVTHLSQVGLAACVTLAIIAGVQYHQDQTKEVNGAPTLNTVPVGVNVAPVGGIQQKNDQQLLEKRQYDKIKLLVQDYELQKRLNAH